MRKHGWQLPYHPLQVVAVSVFLTLGFAYFVFFAPFVGKKPFQYIVMGIYTLLFTGSNNGNIELPPFHLEMFVNFPWRLCIASQALALSTHMLDPITCVFGLYIWCAAADPADPVVFQSKKYLNVPDEQNLSQQNVSELGCQSTVSTHDANASTAGRKSIDKDMLGANATFKGSDPVIEKKNSQSRSASFLLWIFFPCAFIFKYCTESADNSEQQTSEDGMFYCSLCVVEVSKYSKHCRVCDKCVDHFDHHCRWVNNCVGKKNYKQFFTLMVSSLLLLIMQCSTGILVLVLCFLERKRFSEDISTKLGSSFSIIPFVIVVAMFTILAMIATLPLAQLFFFHILLIRKGISTYDYIMALREQELEQEGAQAPQSPQMSSVSSLTGISNASSYSNFRRGAWCTPPRLFVEDQFDVVPPEAGSVSSRGKKVTGEEPVKKKNPTTVRISPWTLARLNAEEVSKAAAEARKKSKILRPVARREAAPFGLEMESSFGSSSRRMAPRPENNRKRVHKRTNSVNQVSLVATEKGFPQTASNFAPLQFEARSAFRTSGAMSSLPGNVFSSPESSLNSPDIQPFEISSSRAEASRQLTGLSSMVVASTDGIQLSRCTSDGYEASGGEDSDHVPSKLVQRPSNWNNILFHHNQDDGSVD